MDLVTLYASLAVLCASCLADSTLNKPECSDVAYIEDDKYVTCTVESSVVAEVEGCLNSSLSTAARVQWCFNGRATCLSNSSDGSENLPSLDVSANGVLHLHFISVKVRGNNIMECSYINSNGTVCGPPTEINLTVFASGFNAFVASRRPEISLQSIPTSDKIATIGRNFSLCVSVHTKGLNGTTYWSVGDVRVDATDLTVPPDINNFMQPECYTCSCLMGGGYIARMTQGHLTSGQTESAYSAFIISLHSYQPEDNLRKKALCYYADVTLSFLTIAVVPSAPGERIDIKFTVADSKNQSETISFPIATVYKQVANDAQLYPLRFSEVSLRPGEDAVLLCNATTAGNSSYILGWALESRDNLLPSIDHTAAMGNFNEESVKELCSGQSGVFQLLLPKFGPDLEVDRDGAIFLLHLAALLVCNAESSFSGSYVCFVNSTKTIDNSIKVKVAGEFRLPTVAVVLLVVICLVITCLAAVVFVMCGAWRCRSLKRPPPQMVPCQHQSISPQHRVSATNQFFFEDGCFEQEFSRDKLQLLSVLGEGQFGQVWKATAEGICPRDTNRSIVAVKTLKPNARWSDKDDLQSELDIMVSIEPHPNIINFLGMCSETDTEPLFILMEFAVYGSLKDYLKKLVTGKMNSVYPRRPIACSCSCHQPHPHPGSSEVTGTSAATHRTHHCALPSLSLDSCDHNPEEAAHAAHLLSLLDSNYNALGSTSAGADDREELMDKLSHGSSELWPSYAGRCAYHPRMYEQYQCQYNYSCNANDYYNSYYNYRGDSTQPSDQPSDSARESPSSLSSPQYVNVPDNEGDRSVGECACACQNHYTCEDGGGNEYSNVSSTGCNYCAPDRGIGPAPGIAGCAECFCQDVKHSGGGGKEKLGYFEFLDYACQISRGMEHLENMKCVHRDLAARNVLIAEKFLLKIGDFGLSRDLSGEDYYRKRSSGKIPARWMAVESLTEMKHTPKSDVWSYGIVLWEILTYGDLPYGKTPMASSIETLASFLKSGHRLVQPASCTSPTYDIMKTCWHSNPDQRPSFTQLAEAFRLVLQKTPEHYNRSIEEVPRHPKITQLETNIFQTLIPPTSSCNLAGEASKRVSQFADKSSMPPAYSESLFTTGSHMSSTDSGCPMSEQGHSLPSSVVLLNTPYSCVSTMDTHKDVQEYSSATGLTEHDYLTLCQQDDRMAVPTLAASLPEERKHSVVLSDKVLVCEQASDQLDLENVSSIKTPPPLLCGEMELKDFKSSPRLGTPHGFSSPDHPTAKSRRNWKPKETEV